jgi:hypothetical protein
MTARRIVVSVPDGAEIKAVAIGGTGKPNTLVDVCVGDVVIKGVLVADSRHSTPEAILPLTVEVEDSDLAERIRTVAVAHHLGVDDSN